MHFWLFMASQSQNGMQTLIELLSTKEKVSSLDLRAVYLKTWLEMYVRSHVDADPHTGRNHMQEFQNFTQLWQKYADGVISLLHSNSL